MDRAAASLLRIRIGRYLCRVRGLRLRASFIEQPPGDDRENMYITCCESCQAF